MANFRGAMPLLILHVLREGEAYGYQIRTQNKQCSGGRLDFKEGALYPTLYRLCADGDVREAGMREQSGRLATYYAITVQGRDRYVVLRREWEEYVEAVERVLGRAVC